MAATQRAALFLTYTPDTEPTICAYMSASKDRQWAPEEDQLLRTLIEARHFFREMVPFFPKRTQMAIESRARDKGLHSGRPAKKYTKNEAFWEIPNPLNSYYSGLMAADGCLVRGTASALMWKCSGDDVEYVTRFIASCGYTGPIQHASIDHPVKGVVRYPYVRINSCQKWHADMERNFSLTPQKTRRLAPPSLTSDLLLCCYLIGYIDGDGCIYPNRSSFAQVNFTSASLAIIEWVKRFTDKHFNTQVQVRERNIQTPDHGRFHHFSVQGLSAGLMIDFLRRIDVPRFARKWDNPAILALIDGYRAKWPHLFAPENELSFDAAGMIVRGVQPALAPVIPLAAPAHAVAA